MEACKFCGMNQSSGDSAYRTPAATPSVEVGTIPRKQFKISPAIKNLAKKIGTPALGLLFIFLAFPGMTYLGRAEWPLFYGHSINTVKDPGVHYICAWFQGVFTILSPIILYWAGRAALSLTNMIGFQIVKRWKNFTEDFHD